MGRCQTWQHHCLRRSAKRRKGVRSTEWRQTGSFETLGDHTVVIFCRTVLQHRRWGRRRLLGRNRKLRSFVVKNRRAKGREHHGICTNSRERNSGLNKTSGGMGKQFLRGRSAPDRSPQGAFSRNEGGGGRGSDPLFDEGASRQTFEN